MFWIGLLLAVAGLGLCIVTICRASHMPPQSSWTISLLVAGTFASGVGVVVTALSGDIPTAFKFACGAALMMLGQVLWSVSNGLRPLDFLNPVSSRDANQH